MAQAAAVKAKTVLFDEVKRVKKHHQDFCNILKAVSKYQVRHKLFIQFQIDLYLLP